MWSRFRVARKRGIVVWIGGWYQPSWYQVSSLSAFHARLAKKRRYCALHLLHALCNALASVPTSSLGSTAALGPWLPSDPEWPQPGRGPHLLVSAILVTSSITPLPPSLPPPTPLLSSALDRQRLRVILVTSSITRWWRVLTVVRSVPPRANCNDGGRKVWLYRCVYGSHAHNRARDPRTSPVGSVGRSCGRPSFPAQGEMRAPTPNPPTRSLYSLQFLIPNSVACSNWSVL